MPEVIPYTTCGTCTAPLGIHSITEESVGKIPGFSVLFGKNQGWHLRPQCCPPKADKFLSLIFKLGGEVGLYTNKSSQHREIDINKCSICQNDFNDENGLSLMELGCQHTVCISCLFDPDKTQEQVRGTVMRRRRPRCRRRCPTRCPARRPGCKSPRTT